MVPPRFSAWTGFILGGLGGWRGGGEPPPAFGPPSGVSDEPPPGRPSFPPAFNFTHPGPPFPIPEGPSSDTPSIPPPYTSGPSTVDASSIPTPTANASQLGDYTVTPASKSSQSDDLLPDSPLSNSEQVGESTWGTLCQEPLLPWLDKPDGTKYATPPWGNHTTKDTDPTIQSNIPVTNVTRSYNWTISRSRISPDGVLRDVILVNNQFPGPMIEANFGDWIEVTVHNNISLPEEGTAMHWHGMLQRETPWMDGTPGVSQCPIAPGESFTYRFRADVHGTSVWHAHYSAQYTGGAVGPMIIHGPSVRSYDIDVGPVMLSDWNHIPYFSMVANVVGTDFSKIPPLSDNGLINGRGRFNCSQPSYSNSTDWLGSYFDSDLEWTCVDDAPRSKFRFQSGKTHRLRLINQGADGVQKFSIDNHTMTVIATDFVPTQPYDTDVITLGVGQRTDILVTADLDPTAAVWMRTQLPGGPICGGLGPIGAPVPPLGAPEPPGTIYPDVLAAIYYEDADTDVEPTSVTASEPVSCENDDLSLTHPDFAIQPAQDVTVLDLVMTLALNKTGNFEWRINNEAYRADFNQPVLYDVKAGQTSFPANPEWNLINTGENRSMVLNVTNLTPFTHPMHLHGHTFFVLSVGAQGTVWDGSTVYPENPMRRDVQIIPAGGYAVLQFEADNPGVWPFHCHVAWHLSSGLSASIISRPEDILEIPGGTKESTCDAWNLYTSSNVVDQIDSGS